MYDLRGDLTNKMNPVMLERIKKAPKPTKVAEALAVVKEFEGKALSLDEIAEVANISDPGRNERSRASDYDVKELGKHPDMLTVQTSGGAYIRYVGGKSLYSK